ncbi:MAG: hypothetical protein PHQ98_01060 [Candidatus ainarchaeum sp.]|nr:hypothetical protein [Candidatus ainarchaeum sp.]
MKRMLFIILGIIFLLISMTFANAQTFNFNCQNTFSCSIKDYCSNVSNAIPALLVGGGGAYNESTGQALPTTYTFSSNTTGENTCTVKVNSTAYFNQSQTDETSSIYINDQLIGKTIDNYCNGPESTSCVYCGNNIQSIFTGTINLNQTNTLRIEGHQSHGVISVDLDCLSNNNCESNIAPAIKTIPNQTMRYSSSLQIDLWDYVSSATQRLSDLNLSISQNNQIANCSLTDNRYINCTSSTNLGQTQLTVTARDNCNLSTSKTFQINVTNQTPLLNVADQSKNCSSNLTNFINLTNYSVDEELSKLTYTILSESNTNLLSCQINNNYLTCDINSCSSSYSDLVIRVTDVLGASSTDNIRITLNQTGPAWKSIPTKCLSNSESQIYDLRNYVTYPTSNTDKNNITFSVSNQSNIATANCYLENNYYLSCNQVSNTQNESTLTLNATFNNASSSTTLLIKSQCTSNNEVTITSDISNICLESCTSKTQLISVKNPTAEKQCFNFELEKLSGGYLDVSLSRNEFCLNSKESTTISLSSNSCTTDSDYYKLRLTDQISKKYLDFTYSIGERCSSSYGEFKINSYNPQVCQGKSATYEIDVSNYSNQSKTINLMAENSFLLPYFSTNNLTLLAGQTKTVKLNVNATNASLGYKSIQLSGTASNYNLEKLMTFEVVDCSEISERNIILSSADSCFDVSRGQNFTGSFTVKRQSNGTGCECSLNNKMGVELFSPDSSALLGYTSIDLKCSEEKIIPFSITIPSDLHSGVNFITFAGKEKLQGVFDDELGTIDDLKFCINVRGDYSSRLLIKSTQIDIPYCSSKLFEVEIINDGDFEQTFNLNELSKPIGTEVIFSENTITVPKKSSKSFYVSISTNPSSLIANNQSVKFTATPENYYTEYGSNSSNSQSVLTGEIFFNITDKITLSDLEIVSYSNKVNLPKGANTEYTVVIKNNSSTGKYNLSITLDQNLPKGITFESKSIDRLNAGEQITLTGKIYSSIDSDINIGQELSNNLVINQGSFIINRVPITIKITENNESGAIFAGLFNMFTNAPLLGFVLVGFLLVMVAIIILVPDTKNYKEPWMGVD